MKQQKWFESDDVNISDVVLFTKLEPILSNTYTYELVVKLEYGNYSLRQKTLVQYLINNKNVNQETKKSVCRLKL